MGKNLQGLLAVVLLGSAGAGAVPAAAHPGDEERTPVVQRLAPAVEGVTARVVPGAVARLELTTDGATTAEVLGTGTQPVLRIGPRGVEANRAAPDWWRFNEPVGIAAVPRDATPQAPARWRLVSRGRTWRWFDHRLHPGGPPAADGWTVPLRVDGRAIAVRGAFEATPLRAALRLDGAADVPGLDVAVNDRPTLTLRVAVSGGETAEVLGPDGERFATIAPDGVSANVRSTAWVPTAQFRGLDLLGAVVDPSADPELVEVSPTAQLVWPDPRLEPPGPVEGRVGTVLQRWSVPVVLRRSGRRVEIAGTTVVSVAPVSRTPPSPGAVAAPGASATGFVVVLLVLSLAGFAGLAVVWRRS